MADLLIRDVPDHVLAALDVQAKRLGLSRVEYVRRQLAAAGVGGGKVSRDDLAWFSAVFADLADPAVMGQAWG